TPGTLTVDLLSDNSTAPGSVLNTIGTISTDLLTSAPTVFTLTAPSGIILSPNTRYWLQATGSGNVMSDYSLYGAGLGKGRDFGPDVGRGRGLASGHGRLILWSCPARHAVEDAELAGIDRGDCHVS